MSLEDIDCGFSIEDSKTELIRRARRLYGWTRIVFGFGMVGRFEKHVKASGDAPALNRTRSRFSLALGPESSLSTTHLTTPLLSQPYR